MLDCRHSTFSLPHRASLVRRLVTGAVLALALPAPSVSNAQPADSINEVPDFHDMGGDPNAALEGNWIITWQTADGAVQARAVLSRGIDRECRSAEGPGCWYAFRRNLDEPWRMSYSIDGEQRYDGNIDFDHEDGPRISYGYRHVASRDTRVSLTDISANEIRGAWDEGTEVWRRVEPIVERVETVSEGQTRSAPAGEAVEVVAEYQGDNVGMRGNRNGFRLNFYGENLWGVNYYWIAQETGLELERHSYICQEADGTKYYNIFGYCAQQGGREVGVSLSVNIWPSARSGLKNVYFNGRNIPLQLKVEGVPEVGPEECPQDFSSYRGTTDDVRCNCPSYDPHAQVWGIDVYTDDSNICAAARHAGLLPEGRGDVVLIPLAGRDAYDGLARHGVASKAYGPWEGSFRFAHAGLPLPQLTLLEETGNAADTITLGQAYRVRATFDVAPSATEVRPIVLAPVSELGGRDSLSLKPTSDRRIFETEYFIPERHDR